MPADAARPATHRDRSRRSRVVPALVTLLAAIAMTAPTRSHAEALPACTVDELAAEVRPPGDGRWTMLDTAYALPADFAPGDLVPLRRAGFDDDRTIRAVVVPDLIALREAAEAAGVPLEVQSAYRSYAYQERTFAYWVERQGYEAALATSARAGHSEHQLGTTLDLRALGGPAPWDHDFGATPTGRWLAEHAWRYGFVMSYPSAVTGVTCYAHEPWHWRWVGRDVAADVRELGTVLRVYLWDAP